jgi:general secretion pathway protein G
MKTKTTKRTAGYRGFSLLELMLVLAIIGVLTAVAAWSVFGQGEKAKRKATRASMAIIKNALDQYHLDKSAWPASLTALQAGKTPYLEASKPLVDGWNQPFLYQAPGSNQHDFDLFSKGGNGVFENGGGDDVDFWRADSE